MLAKPFGSIQGFWPTGTGLDQTTLGGRYEVTRRSGGREGFEIYQALCETDGVRHDPCVLDVFISLERFMAGEAPRAWWTFTAERKARYPNI